MLKIKLQPTGKKHQRFYRIVVAEDRSKLQGTIIDSLGTYDPHNPQNTLNLDTKSYQLWIRKGAQPTETVRKLVK